ncbi:hypothetical protein [Methylomicrobium sp. Wu6]|uniref:hypothetical protein n=1 Tax=Methylomicrobium sp. Wu6 TaxID=3107928 RepID=UPI002DD6336F|nr:hypothetical protein [Methylomicrobium sp. Wu6]MEC4750011.1 hypothetical protein [Methylomicrobium sp. Wu6]
MRKLKRVMWLIWSAAILNSCMVIGGGKAAEADFCAAVPEPKPFTKQVNLEIFEGNLLKCDEGCEQLVREYTAQIAAHQAACAK